MCHPQTFRCAAPSGLVPTWRWHHRSARCKRAKSEKPQRSEGSVMPGPRQSRMVILHPETDLRGLHAPRTQGASDFLTNRGGAPSGVGSKHGTLPPTALTSETASHGWAGLSQKPWPLITSSPFLPPAAILLLNKYYQRPTV